MIKNGVRIVVVLLVVAAAIGLLQKRKHDRAQQAPTAAILPVVLDAVVPGRSDVTLTLPALGIVSSDVSTTLSTKVSGRVTAILN